MVELIERWPGYNEQSWAERFAELDARYASLQKMLIGTHLALFNARQPPEGGAAKEPTP